MVHCYGLVCQASYDYLGRGLDTNDRIVITELTSGRHQGWLRESVWDWVNARL